MDKGYYQNYMLVQKKSLYVAIHNKNGQGLLPMVSFTIISTIRLSQSTIKMDKGYYSYLILPLKKEYISRNPQ